MKSNIVVGVLRGGPSNEHEVSLKSGEVVLSNLPKNFLGMDILISKEGQWSLNNRVLSPQSILSRVDVCFNALHGTFGEDGGVQKILDEACVPYTGPGRFGAALSMNKYLTKNYLEIPMVSFAKNVILSSNSLEPFDPNSVLDQLGLPVVVKPVMSGSSVGVRVVSSVGELEEAVKEGFKHSSSVMVEEYIEGREATCGVLESFQNKNIFPLSPVEIIPPVDHNFFDYQAKYSGESREICPGDFSVNDIQIMQNASVLAHQTLGLQHYSRTDFIIHPERGIFFLETNSLPGLSPTSLLPLSLKEAGLELPDFFEHVIDLALRYKF